MSGWSVCLKVCLNHSITLGKQMCNPVFNVEANFMLKMTKRAGRQAGKLHSNTLKQIEELWAKVIKSTYWQIIA